MISRAAGDHHLVRRSRGPAPRGGRRRSAPSSRCRDSAPATASRPGRPPSRRRRRAAAAACWRAARSRASRSPIVSAWPRSRSPMPLAAALEQMRVQRREAGGTGTGTRKLRRAIADQPLDLALVVALARPAEPIGEQVMRLQLAEHPRPLALAVAQDPRHRELGVVVEDRLRHPAEEGERRTWPSQNASVVSAG